jgi:hypothetical protein
MNGQEITGAFIPEVLPPIDPSKREFLRFGGTALVGGVAGAVILPTPGCPGAKNLSTWVTIIVADFSEMKPLLGELGLSQVIIDRVSGFIDKAVAIARDFDSAYKAGKFSDAVTLFTNLGGIVSQIAAELNVTNNRIVKLALVSISIARIAIASLLNAQAQQPEVMAAVNSARKSAVHRANVSEIERLANADLSKIQAALP